MKNEKINLSTFFFLADASIIVTCGDLSTDLSTTTHQTTQIQVKSEDKVQTEKTLFKATEQSLITTSLTSPPIPSSTAKSFSTPLTPYDSGTKRTNFSHSDSTQSSTTSASVTLRKSTSTTQTYFSATTTSEVKIIAIDGSAYFEEDAEDDSTDTDEENTEWDNEVEGSTVPGLTIPIHQPMPINRILRILIPVLIAALSAGVGLVIMILCVALCLKQKR